MPAISQMTDGVQWTDVATFGTAVAGLVLLLFGVFYAGFQLYLVDQDRRLGILIELSRRWDSQALRDARRGVNKARKKLKEKLDAYDAKDDEKYYLMMTVANFFEDVGIVTVKRNLWSVKEADDRFGASIAHYFSLFADYIKDQQEKENDDRIFENFSKLAAEVRKLQS